MLDMNATSSCSVIATLSTPTLKPAYLWRLCRTQHQLPLPGIQLDQSPTAGFSVLLQLLLLPFLHLRVAGRVVVGSWVMAVAVSLRQTADIAINKNESW